MATEHVEVDRRSLVLLVAALRKEADGKELRRDLVRNLRAVATPALQAARAAILAMPSMSTREPGLRASVAKQTKISVTTTGRRAGIRIRALKTGMPRGFRNAPKRLNSRKGWRHPVFGNREVWRSQMGQPGWFDDTIPPFKPAAVAAAAAAMDAVARRVSQRTRG